MEACWLTMGLYGQLASTNFTAAMRISNCRGMLASLKQLHLCSVSERTPKQQDGKLYLPCAQVTGNHKATRVKICKTGLSALLPENVLNLNEGIS